MTNEQSKRITDMVATLQQRAKKLTMSMDDIELDAEIEAINNRIADAAFDMLDEGHDPYLLAMALLEHSYNAYEFALGSERKARRDFRAYVADMLKRPLSKKSKH